MSLISKSARYISRQADHIAKFGERTIIRDGVSEDMLERIVPFRRLSNKPGTLSDPKHFISRFEQETGSNFLPKNWVNLSECEKVDYIVKDRYSRIVSNKIMNGIKNEDTEHLFCLNPDGDIVHYSHGDRGFCSNFGVAGGTSIHNHPGYLKTEYSDVELEYIMKNCPERVEGIVPFSDSDILTALGKSEKAAYVVDSQGHKFLFKPRTITDDKELTKEVLALRWDLNDISARVFPSAEVHNGKVRNTNKLLEQLDSYQEKQKKYGRLFFPNRGYNKRLDAYIKAKTDILSLEPFAKVKKELEALSKEYGFKFEQLS